MHPASVCPEPGSNSPLKNQWSGRSLLTGFEFDVVPLTRVDSCHSSAGKPPSPSARRRSLGFVRFEHSQGDQLRRVNSRWVTLHDRVGRRSRLIGRLTAGAKLDYRSRPSASQARLMSSRCIEWCSRGPRPECEVRDLSSAPLREVRADAQHVRGSARSIARMERRNRIR